MCAGPRAEEIIGFIMKLEMETADFRACCKFPIGTRPGRSKIRSHPVLVVGERSTQCFDQQVEKFFGERAHPAAERRSKSL